MPKYAAYQPAAPYFDLVRGALGDLVDGDHFFDVIDDDIIYEVLYDVSGWPRVIQGRTDLMAAFKGYVDNIALQSADQLIAHKADLSDLLARMGSGIARPGPQLVEGKGFENAGGQRKGLLVDSYHLPRA